ncbi:MAG: hypothetical protein QF406_03150 [Verrucomicrobiota bacterium]|jgi:hypothetical protein|nr:hypothetical protein [Verrucomicrobiota bacterium]
MERTLLLVSIIVLSLPAHSAERLKLKFKDGTTLNGAEIYVPTIRNSTGNPNGYGVILKYHNKLYIHHFPYRQPHKVTRYTDGGVDNGKYKAVQVTEELEHYQPRSSPLEPSPRELGYSCTPSRIAFFHFDRPTLHTLQKVIMKDSRISLANKRSALKSIQGAYYASPNPRYYNTPQTSRIWQAEADRDVTRYKDKVFYGKWMEQPSLAPPEFQKLLRPRRQRTP